MVVWEVCPALVSPKSIVPPVLRDTTPGLAQSGVVFVVPPPPGRVPLDTTSRLEPDSGFPCLAMRRDSFKACFAFRHFPRPVARGKFYTQACAIHFAKDGHFRVCLNLSRRQSVWISEEWTIEPRTTAKSVGYRTFLMPRWLVVESSFFGPSDQGFYPVVIREA